MKIVAIKSFCVGRWLAQEGDVLSPPDALAEKLIARNLAQREGEAPKKRAKPKAAGKNGQEASG